MKVCPSCGEENPERFRLCGFCGAKLEPEAAQEARKLVTVVFADLVGSTSLGETLDSESLRALMSRYFDEMRAIVEEAHRVKIKVAAHATTQAGIQAAIDGGVDSIEHGDVDSRG